MKQPRGQQHITSLAALVLLAVFAVSILLVLLEGASIYRRITDRGQDAWKARTAAGYITTRFRQENRRGALAVEELDGIPALTLGLGEEYLTRLYCYDGALWELYCPAELTMSPADGERLLELQAMELELSDGILQVELTTPAGSVQQLTLALCGGEGSGL